MTYRATLAVSAHDRPFRLIVEPWAEEFTIAPGDQCLVVAIHPAAPPTFGTGPCGSGDVMVWVSEGGVTFEFWRNGVLEFRNLVATPAWPPEV